MKMTIDQYIMNPMGKSNAVLNSTARESIRNDYVKRFGAIMLRENGKIAYFLYHDAKKNEYWAHIKVPSEVVSLFYYDVVFKFHTDAKVLSGGEDLSKYFVQFFSNDPSFVFTYANVFSKNELLIKELYPKMSKEALKKAPKEKNAGMNIGYVKAIYFAYLYMKQKGLFNLTKFKAESIKFDLKVLLSQVIEADIIIEDRQKKGALKKEKTKKNQNNITGDRGNSNSSFSSPKISIVKSVGNILSTNRSNFVKSTKRVKKK